MKTTNRYQNKPTPTMPEDSEPDWYVLNQWCARAKRKNKIAQYKHTIALLKYRLKDTEDCLRFTQKVTKCFIVRPDHWRPRDENGNELTRKQWRAKLAKEKQP